ncbi:MAG: YggT family protein [Chloroflexota bacterium]|nr:YggT family protein [Chloroflexota bacterium]
MTYEERTVREDDGVVASPGVTTGGSTVVQRRVTRTPSGGEMAGRIVVLLFGIVQTFIIARIVLLLLDAREGNDLVAFILNTSQIFVGPFEGILRTDALASGGSVFDVTAVLALVGWTILEALILAAVGIFRREPRGA